LSNPGHAWSNGAGGTGADNFDLDDVCCDREESIMNKTPLLAAAASAVFLLLPACRQGEPERLNAYDPQGEALKNAAPVALPPAITDNRTYRCSDNSLLYVEFYNNGTAMIRTTREGTPTQLAQTGGAGPYSGGSYTVSGNATHVTINGKSCHT
jgi:membrane-bound inhibitor of C-type lysozyme